MNATLLLNTSYEPLRIISWKKALTLLFAGKVEVIEEYQHQVHSITFAIKLPSIIRLLKMTIDAAHKNGLWAGVCGEMAGDITLAPLLLGLGVDELSAGAALVPRVKRAVQALDFAAKCADVPPSTTRLLKPADVLEVVGIALSFIGDGPPTGGSA